MRAINGTVHRKRRRKILKAASGFRGGRHRLYRTARQAVMKAGLHAYVSRRQKKRQMRSLWITRINAASRLHGLSYSVFMNNLKKANIELDRRMLAELAVSDPAGFQNLLESIK